jgi:DMSO reductase anchor subunit
MWRRSWLSREVLLFGLFFVALAALTAVAWISLFHPLPHSLLPSLSGIATLLGIAGIIASAFIYLVPARPAWNTPHTPIDFLLSAALLGSTLPSLLENVATLIAPILHLSFSTTMSTRPHAIWPALLTPALWLTNQSIRLIRLNRSPLFEHRASAALLNTTDLRAALILSFGLIFSSAVLASIGSFSVAFVGAFIGVLLSRYLFFVSVVPLNMALTFTRGGDR